ncbi:hypothetical protein BDV98DRAFT_284116 [Pterulicium gracile]|uniref:Uncharacterized protein n=1 Tax=Pterulicium gracile TaxID=1884261 RepID=A0A5C3R2X0_9AGAR|nr:hypothetical protein BDV98DRAFT_284116 [Pterula gracilis]
MLTVGTRRYVGLWSVSEEKRVIFIRTPSHHRRVFLSTVVLADKLLTSPRPPRCTLEPTNVLMELTGSGTGITKACNESLCYIFLVAVESDTTWSDNPATPWHLAAVCRKWRETSL